jgi:hypothetical protein
LSNVYNARNYKRAKRAVSELAKAIGIVDRHIKELTPLIHLNGIKPIVHQLMIQRQIMLLQYRKCTTIVEAKGMVKDE